MRRRRGGSVASCAPLSHRTPVRLRRGTRVVVGLQQPAGLHDGGGAIDVCVSLRLFYDADKLLIAVAVQVIRQPSTAVLSASAVVRKL